MVSVIITCYEGDRHLIGTAIDSCLDQDVKTEIIVVDAGTRKLHRDNNILLADRYIHLREDKTQSFSVNVGVLNATNEYIVVLDADDALYSNVLGKMVSSMNGVDVVYGNMTQEWGGNILRPMEPNIDNFKICNPIFWTSMFRRSVFHCVGCSDMVVYMDYRLWIKMFLWGAKFKYLDETIYNHEFRTGSITDKMRDKSFQLDEEARIPLYE